MRQLHSYKLGRHIALFLATAMATTITLANPQGGQVASGNANISQSGSTTTIQQNTQQAIINWQSFNIAGGEKTQFNQPKGGIALNRINPQNGMSKIYGSLNANGSIILVNGAGIYFGPGSMVNVGSLIASTGEISDRNFLNKKYIFSHASKYSGSIINEGTIKAADYGLVAFLGTGVVNNGLVQAEMGNIVMGSGNKFTLDFNGDQLINFTVNQETKKAGVDQNGNKLTNGVLNNGKILADGGRILVTARAAAGVLDNAIYMRGVAQAHSVRRVGGEIILSAGSGRVRVSGKLSTAGRHKHSKGGNIEILGNDILLTSTANINASGGAGGGNIYIGGNEHGTGPLQDALNTTVDAGAIINASAIHSGNGGNVIVWANNTTNFAGTILAQGGSQSGNGGFSEVSGHDLLNFAGSVNLTAAHGAKGNLLLDPQDITIQDSGTDSTNFSGGVYTPTIDESILTVATLVAQLQLSDVTVMTSGSTGSALGNITVANDISWSNSANGGTSLTLDAANQILLNANITATDGNSNVNFLSPVVVGANVAVTAGNQISFNSTVDDSAANTHSLTLNANNISLMNNIGSLTPLANITFNDSQNDGGQAAVQAGNTSSSIFSMTAGTSLTLNANFDSSTSGDFSLNSATITMNGTIGNNSPFNNLTISDASGGNTGQLYVNEAIWNVNDAITIHSLVDGEGGAGNGALQLSANTIELDKNIGSSAALSFLSTEGQSSVTFNGSSITTAGSQNYNLNTTAATLSFNNATSISLTTTAGGDIRFGPSVNFNTPTTTITADQEVVYNGNVEGATALTSRGINGGNSIYVAGTSGEIGSSSIPLTSLTFLAGGNSSIIGQGDGIQYNNNNSTTFNIYTVGDQIFNNGISVAVTGAPLNNFLNLNAANVTINNHITSESGTVSINTNTSGVTNFSGHITSAGIYSSILNVGTSLVITGNSSTDDAASTITFQNSPDLTINSGSTLTMNGQFGSSTVNSLNKNGNGDLIMEATQSNLSTLNINAGLVGFDGSNNIMNGTVNVASGGTLSIDNNVQSGLTINLNGNGSGSGALIGTGSLAELDSSTIVLQSAATIGAPGSGDVFTFDSGTSFDGATGAEALTLAGAGTININGSMGTNAGFGSLTSTVANLTLGLNSVNTSGDQNYNAGIITLNDNDGSETFNFNSSSGNINFNNSTLTFADVNGGNNNPYVINGNLTLTGATLIDTNPSNFVTVTGNITIGAGNTVLSDPNTSNGAFEFSGTVDADSSHAGNLFIAGGTDRVQFDNSIGSNSSLNSVTVNNTAILAMGNGNPTTDLSINTVNDIDFSSGDLYVHNGGNFAQTVNLNSSSGSITFNNGSTIVSDGLFFVFNNVNLNANTTINSNLNLDASLLLNIGSGKTLTLNNSGAFGNGSLNVDGTLIMNTSIISSMNALNGSGTIIVPNNSSLIIDQVNQDGGMGFGGTYQIGTSSSLNIKIPVQSGFIKTGTGDLTFSGSSDFVSGTQVDIQQGSLSIEQTTEGSIPIVMESGTTLNIGNNVDPNIAIQLNGASIVTTGSNDFNGTLTVTNGTNTITSSNAGDFFEFNKTVDSDSSHSGGLTLAGPGQFQFDADVGTTNPLSYLTLSNTGGTNIGGNVTTIGEQDYQGAVNITGASTLTGSELNFEAGSVLTTQAALTLVGADVEFSSTSTSNAFNGNDLNIGDNTTVTQLNLNNSNALAGINTLSINNNATLFLNADIAAGAYTNLNINAGSNLLATANHVIAAGGVVGSNLGSIEVDGTGVTLDLQDEVLNASLIKNGTGILSLDEYNGGSGNQIIISDGTLTIPNPATSDNYTGVVISVSDGATLNLNGITSGNGVNGFTVALNGNGVGGNGALTFTGANALESVVIELQTNSTISIPTSADSVTFDAQSYITTATNSNAGVTINVPAGGIALPFIDLTDGGLGNLTVNAAGAITQTDVLAVSATSTFNAGGAPITLTNTAVSNIDSSYTGNNLAGGIDVSNSGANDINIVNYSAMTINTLSAGRQINFTSTNGDISVIAAPTLTNSNTLTLNAANGKIFLNADITNGNLILNTGSFINSGTEVSPSATGVTANINVSTFSLEAGNWTQVNSTLPTFTVANAFSLNNGNGENAGVQFIRALSGNGSSGSPYLLTDIYGVQGINSNATTLTKAYKLNNDVSASVTSHWNVFSGFYAIGRNSDDFSGDFNGAGHVITSLFINSNANNAGLFATVDSTATIENLGIVTPNVTGFNNAGALAGLNNGTLNTVYVSGGTVAGGANGGSVGGLVGDNTGSISIADNNGTAVTVGNGGTLGGLVGFSSSNGTIANSYNSGSVTISDSGLGSAGGLVGSNRGSISTSYNVGLVTDAGSNNIGALVGQDSGGTYLNNYYDSDTSGAAHGTSGGDIANITPLTDTQMQDYTNFTGFNFTSGSPATWAFLQSGYAYPVLTSITPGPYKPTSNGISITGQVIGGNADSISFFLNGISLGSVTTDASGNYTFSSTSATSGGDLLAYITTSGFLSSSVTLATSANTSITGLNFKLNTLGVGDSGTNSFTNTDLVNGLAGLSSALALFTVSGNNITLNSGINFFTTATSTFGLNGNISSSGNIQFGGATTLSQDATVATSSGTINLNSINGANQLTLSSTGGTTIAGVVGGSTPLDTITITGAVTLDNNVTTTEGQVYHGDVTLGGNVAVTATGNSPLVFAGSIIGGGHQLSLTSGGSSTLAGTTATGSATISNLSQLILSSFAGQFTIFGNNTAFGGTTLINSGAVFMASATALGNLASNTIIVNNPAETVLIAFPGDSSTIANNFSLTGTPGHILGFYEPAGSNTLSGNISLAGTDLWLLTPPGTSLTLSGNISGSTGLMINNTIEAGFTGTVNLSGANSFTGNITLENGILNLASAGAIGNGTNNAAGIEIFSGAELDLSLNNATYTAAVPLQLDGGTGVSGNGALYDTQTTNTTSYTGTVTQTAASTIGVASGTNNSLALSNNISLGNATLTLATQGASRMFLGGVISSTGTSGGITFNGGQDSAIVVAGANTYTGATVIQSGIWDLNISSALGATSSVLVNSGGTLYFAAAGTYNAASATNITVNGAGSTDAGIAGVLMNETNNVVLGSNYNILLGSTSTFGVNTGSFTIDGTIGIAPANTNPTNLTINYSNASVGVSLGNIDLTGNSNAGNLTVITSNGATTNGAITQQASTALKVGGTSSFTAGTASISLANSSNAFTGAVSASNNGAHDLTLFSGGAITLGTIAIGRTINVQSNGSSITLGNAISLVSANTLQLNGHTTIELNNNVTGGAGAVVLIAPTVDLGANITLNTAIMDLTGSVNGNNHTLAVANTDASSFISGGISSLSGLTVNGTGTLTLQAVNFYTGLTTVNAGATLTVNNSIVGALTNNGTFNAQNTFAITDLNGSTVGATLNIASGKTLTVAPTTADTYAGVIASAGALTVLGASGTSLILSNVNTYSGGTSVNGGTLSAQNIGALGSAGISVGSGATLDFNFAANGTLSNTSSISLADGSALTFSGSKNITVNNALALAGTTTIGGANSGTLNTLGGVISGAGGALNMTGSDTILLSGNSSFGTAGTTGFTLNGGTISVGSNSSLGVGNLVLTSGTIQANSANNLTLAQAYSVNGTASIGGSNNFTLSNTGTFTSGTLSLTDTSNSNLTGTLTGSGALTVNSVSGTSTIGSASSANSGYSGIITLTSGALNIGSDANIDPLGTGTLKLNGGILEAGTAIVTNPLVNPYIVGGAVAISGSGGSITLSNAGTLTSGTLTVSTSGSSVVTLSGNLTGSAAINVNTANTAGLVLSGANTNTSAITVTTGFLSLNSAGAIGNGTTNAASILVSSGGELDLGAFTYNSTTGVTLNGTGFTHGAALYVTNTGGGSFNGNLTLGSAATIGEIASGTFSLGGTVNNGANTVTYNAASGATLTEAGAFINSGSGGLINSGAGKLILSGANTYTGATNDNAGTLSIQNIGGLGTGVGSQSSAINVANGATLDFAFGANGTLTSTASMALATGSSITFSGANNNTINNALALAGATTIGGTGTGTGNTLGGIISGASGVLTKSGTDLIILNNANTFGTAAVTGVTLSGGTLSIGNNSALGIGNLVMSSGTLVATSANNLTLANPLTISGTSTIGGTNNITFTNTAAVNAALTVNDSATAALSGVVSGAGTVTESGTGTLVLTGANTFTGGYNVSSGFLSMQSTGSLGTGAGNNAAGVTITATGELDLGNFAFTSTAPLSVGGTGTNAAVYANVAGTTSYSGAISLTGGTTYIGAITGNTFNISGNTNTVGTQLVFQGAGNINNSGIISNGGSVQQMGTGTLTLSGVNTYNGGTVFWSGIIDATNNSALGQNNLDLKGGTLITDNTGNNPLTFTQNIIVDTNSGATTSTIGGNNNVTFNNSTMTFNSGDTLNITNMGTTTFNGVGNGAGSLTSSGTAGNIILGSSATLGVTTALTTVNIGNTLTMNSSAIRTSGAQTYSGALTLANTSTTLTSTGNGAMNFGAINGGTVNVDSLTLSDGTGVITFNGAIGGGVNGALNNLTTVSGNTGGLILPAITLAGNLSVTTSAGSIFQNNAITGSGNVSLIANGSSTNGDVTVNNTIGWGASSTLTLTATNHIYLNTAISGNSLALSAANTTQTGSATADITSGTEASPNANGVNVSVAVTNFNLVAGGWYQNNSTLPTFTNTNFQLASGSINPAATTQFIRANGGAGTTGSPYQLTDIFGLQGVATLPAASFIMNSSISASATSSWTNATGTGFVPVGASTVYTGTFNGNGFSINNLTLSAGNSAFGSGNFGLFDSVTGTIKNLGLSNETITGTATSNLGIVQIGGLVGLLNVGASISNDWMTGSISYGLGATTSIIRIGGLVGNENGGLIANSYAAGNVSVSGSGTGGAILGGLVGSTGNASGIAIQQSYFSGNLTSALTGSPSFNSTGGLTGELRTGTAQIKDSYATGTLTANSSSSNSMVGGFIGSTPTGSSITNSYSAVYVLGAAAATTGGFAGKVQGTLSGDFFDTGYSGQANGVGGAASTTGLTPGTLNGSSGANLSSITTYSTFNIAANATSSSGTIWGIIPGSSYPYLTSFYSAAPVTISGTTTGLAAGTTINLADNGVAVSGGITSVGAVTGSGATASGSYYFLLATNAVANNDSLLIYGGTGTNLANDVSLASSSGFGGANLAIGVLQIGNSSTSTISNTNLALAAGSLGSTKALYSVDGSNNLTLGNVSDASINLIATANTSYNANGNIVITSGGTDAISILGNATFGGSVGTSSNRFTTVSVAGTTTVSSNASIFTSGNQAYTGAMTLNAGLTLDTSTGTSNTISLAAITGNANNLTLNTLGTATLNGAFTSTGNFTFGSAGALVVNNVASNPFGTGILSFTSSGSLTVNTAGTSLGNSSVTTGGALALNGSQSISISGAMTLGGNLTLNNTGTSVITLGNVSGTGFGITDSGTAATKLILQGSDTFTGALSTSAGIISAQNVNALGNGTLNASSIGVTGTGELDLGNFAFNSTSAITLNGTGTNGALYFNTAGTGSYKGAITLGSASTISAIAGSNFTLNSTSTINNAGFLLTFTPASTSTITANGIISGSGGLTQNGAGTVTLGAVNTYTGLTTINSGDTLTVTGSISKVVTDNGIFNVQNTFGITDFTGTNAAGSLAISSGAVLTVAPASADTYAGIVSGLGGLTVNGASSLTLSNASNSYSGATTLTAGTLIAGANNAFGLGTLNLNGGALQSSVNVTLANSSVAVGGNMAINGSHNITFTNTTIANSIASGDILNINGSGTITFNNLISGSGGITVNTAGTLALSGANTYSGITSFSSGFLQAAAAGTSLNSVLTTASTATTINGTNSITFNNGANIATGNTLYLTNTGVTTFGQDSTTSHVGLTGPGTLNIQASSTAVVQGDNHTFTGAITVLGKLQVGDDNIKPLGTGTVTLTGGTLQAIVDTTTNAITNAITVSASSSGTISGASAMLLGGLVTIGSGSTLTLSNTNTNGVNFAGGISGAGSLSITASDVAAISGTNTVATPIVVNGTLNVLGTNTLSGVISGAGTIGVSGTDTFSGSNTFNGTMNLTAGSLIANNATNALGAGTLNLSGGTLSAGVVATLGNSSISVTNAAAIGGTLGLTITNGIAISTGIALTNGNTATTTLNGLISGDGSLILNAGTTVLNHANSYTGGTTLNNAAIVTLNSLTGAGTGLITSNNTSEINITQSGTYANAITLNNTVSAVNNINVTTAMITPTLSGALTINGTSIIDSNGFNNVFTMNGLMSGAGTFTYPGTNTFRLGGTGNTFTGTIIATGSGTLQAQTNNAFGAAGATLNINGSPVSFQGENEAANIIFNTSGLIAFNGSGYTLSGNFVVNSALPLTVASGNTVTISGTISGTQALTINGAGTVELSGSDNSGYTQGITLSSGILELATTNATGSGAFTMSGGTLESLASISLNNSGYTVSGNTSLGGSNNITFNHAVAINSGNTLAISNTGVSTFSNAITGAGGLSQSAGTVVLTGSNTYSGATTLSSGTLQANTSGASLSGNLNVTGNASIGGANNLTLNTTSLASGKTLSLSNMGTTVFGGVVSGAGSLAQSSGIVELSASNSYGNTSLTGGTMEINNASNALGTGTLSLNGGALSSLVNASLANAVSIGSNFTIGGTNNLSFTNTISLTSGGTLSITNSGTTTFAGITGAAAISGTNSASSVIFNSALSGLSSISMAGATTLNGASISTTGNQAYTGLVTLGANTTLNSNSNISLTGGISGAGKNLTITGGNANNVITLGGNLALNNISVTGGSGNNNSLAVLTNNAQTWNISGSNSGAITGMTGETGTFSLSNIENLNGSNNGDTFHINGGSLAGVLTGGSGNNVLVADNVADTFNISGTNSGNVNNAVGFANIQNLTGGNVSNNFVFANGGGVSGNITGTGSNNTLDYSAYSSTIAVTLTADNIGVTTNNQGSQISNFTDIQNVNSNGNAALYTAANKNNSIILLTPTSGTANDPVSFTGFNTFGNVGSGSGSVTFPEGSTVIFTGPNTATINGVNVTFAGINTFNGNSTPFVPPPPAPPTPTPAEDFNNFNGGTGVSGTNLPNIINSPTISNGSNNTVSGIEFDEMNALTTFVDTNLIDLMNYIEMQDTKIIIAHPIYRSCRAR